MALHVQGSIKNDNFSFFYCFQLDRDFEKDIETLQKVAQILVGRQNHFSVESIWYFFSLFSYTAVYTIWIIAVSTVSCGS